MSQFPSPFGLNRSQPWQSTGTADPAIIKFFNAVYIWMAVGLAVTAVVALLVADHRDIVLNMGRGIWLLFIVELGLVWIISAAINRINAALATLLFIVYAAINGVVLSSLLLLYDKGTLASAFFISAGTFGVMSVYGMVTHTDLTTVGKYLRMVLFGLVIATIVSLFWHDTTLQVVINYVGVLLFVALTAYDTQKLKYIAQQTRDNPALAARLSVVGSLVLYLDFINLFIFILRILGNRSRR